MNNRLISGLLALLLPLNSVLAAEIKKPIDPARISPPAAAPSQGIPEIKPVAALEAASAAAAPSAETAAETSPSQQAASPASRPDGTPAAEPAASGALAEIGAGLQGPAPLEDHASVLRRVFDGPSGDRGAEADGDSVPPSAAESPSAPAAASPDSGGQALDRPFYGRQNPLADKPKTRKYRATPEESDQARREFLELALRGDEIFNAPTWFEKGEYPELKRAIFAIAFLDEALTDIVNGQEGDIPADLQTDVVTGLLARRARMLAVYRLELEKIEGRSGGTRTSRTQRDARARLEHLHNMGLTSPVLDAPPAGLPDEFRILAAAYQDLREIAAGRKKASHAQVAALGEAYTEALRGTLLLRQAREVDTLVAFAARSKASPDEAKAIYDLSNREAKDPENHANLEHLAAQIAAVDAGTLVPVERFGKQIRPTCTMHMLAGILAAMGVRRDLTELIREARQILNDPYVGMTTAFTYKQQLRLFRHYGKLHEVKENLFQTLVAKRRSLKISIEIGDPIYKHSLILEGFYQVFGRTYIALADSTSYFRTRMAVEDFARVLTSDNAVLFLEAYPVPKAGKP